MLTSKYGSTTSGITTSRKTGATTYSTEWCVAPIVSSLNQSRVLYWAWGGRSCCTAISVGTCWSAYPPGTPLAGYAYTLTPTAVQNVYLDAKYAANVKLAAASGASVLALEAQPAVFVVLVDASTSPEATVDTYYSRATVYVGVMTGIFFGCPLLVFCMCGGA